MPLVVNILINPNLFFCRHDATLGQYRRYFRPVYLDSNAILLDEGKVVDDYPATSIVNLHKAFDEHYTGEVRNRQFISLNDIEALINSSGIGNPFPPAGTVISISRNQTSHRHFDILGDTTSYWSQIDDGLLKSRVQNARQKLYIYLNLVTGHGGSYHHVTIGSEDHWLGRVYLAFRDHQDVSDEWIALVRDFAFEIVSPLALAGTFLRNKGVIRMFAGIRLLLHQAENFRADHWAAVGQFAGSAASETRKLLPSSEDIAMTLKSLNANAGHRLAALQRHITEVVSCSYCSHNLNEPVRHAAKDCRNGGSVGFVNDLKFDVGRAFRGIHSNVAEVIAHSLTVGFVGVGLGNEQLLKIFFESVGIPWRWVAETGYAKWIKDIPPELHPYVRALLLMAGNREMVESNARRLDVKLQEGGPQIVRGSLPDGRITLNVQYAASGTLRASEELPLTQTIPLHPRQARLLLYFGRQVFDGFEMCISSKVESHTVTRKTDGWRDNIPAADGNVTYGFRFAL